MHRRLLHRLALASGLVLMLIGMALVVRQLGGVSWSAVRLTLESLSVGRLALALSLVAASYAWLVLFDALALQQLGARLEPRRVALASFGGYALSHSLGFAALTAGSLRLRLYTRWGLRGAQVAKLIGFLVLTYWVGLLARGALVFLCAPPALPGGYALPLASFRALGLALLAASALLFLASAHVRMPLRWGNHSLRLPRTQVLLQQVLLGTGDWILSGAVFWVLLGPEGSERFAEVLAAMVLAQVAMAASQVPGGLGVLEAVLLFALRNELPAARILGALLAYRVLYYALPLLLAGLLLSLHEARARRGASQALKASHCVTPRAVARQADPPRDGEGGVPGG